jgi:F0F1-type ATP synthase membrane subunit c/vacuolar-type H+-ATPase subunit K
MVALALILSGIGLGEVGSRRVAGSARQGA